METPLTVKPKKLGRIFGWKDLSVPATLINENQAIVTYYPNYLSKIDADALFKEMEQHKHNRLLTREPWNFRGKKGWTRRKSVAFGEEGLSYSYAGKTRIAIGWNKSPLLYELKKRIQKDTGQMLNYALVNLYPNGEADIPWHSDKERDMAQDSLIISVSLGEERPFQFRKKKGKADILTIDPLKHGSILIMNMATQHHYLHSLPKRSVKKYNKPRYNITFRLMRGTTGLSSKAM